MTLQNYEKSWFVMYEYQRFCIKTCIFTLLDYKNAPFAPPLPHFNSCMRQGKNIGETPTQHYEEERAVWGARLTMGRTVGADAPETASCRLFTDDGRLVFSDGTAHLLYLLQLRAYQLNVLHIKDADADFALEDAILRMQFDGAEVKMLEGDEHIRDALQHTLRIASFYIYRGVEGKAAVNSSPARTSWSA